MAPVPGSPWKCVSRMTSLPPSPHTHIITITSIAAAELVPSY